MTSQEFSAIVKDLLTDGGYGHNAYSPAQLSKLWQIVKDINASEFRHVIEQLALISTKAPSLAQIRAQCMTAINRSLEDKRRERISVAAECSRCGGSGWVTVRRRDPMYAHLPDPTYEVSYICPCPASEARGIKPGRGASYWRPEVEAQ